MSLRVEEYVRADGSIPYRTWFESLDPQQADIARAKALHAEYKVRKAATKRHGAVSGSRTSRKRR